MSALIVFPFHKLCCSIQFLIKINAIFADDGVFEEYINGYLFTFTQGTGG